METRTTTNPELEERNARARLIANLHPRVRPWAEATERLLAHPTPRGLEALREAFAGYLDGLEDAR